MEIIKEINLNINQPNNFELINVMQGSLESVKVIAHLYDGNQPYQIPETVTEYQILGILPSGKYLIDDQVTKYDSNSVTFFINPNMMAKAGYVKFTISLVAEGDRVIVETFPAKIMVTAIPGQDYEQTDEIPIITKALQETKRNADKAENEADRAKYEADRAESEANRSEHEADRSWEYYEKLAAQKGQPKGIATLDENGKVPLSQLDVPFEMWKQTEPSVEEQRINDYWLVEYY